MHAALTFLTYLFALGANVALLGFGFRVTKQMQRNSESSVVKDSSTIVMASHLPVSVASDLPVNVSAVEPSNIPELEDQLTDNITVTAASLFLRFKGDYDSMRTLDPRYLTPSIPVHWGPSRYWFESLEDVPGGVRMKEKHFIYELQPDSPGGVDEMLRSVCSAKLLGELINAGAFGSKDNIKPFLLSGFQVGTPTEVRLFGYFDEREGEFLVVKFLRLRAVQGPSMGVQTFVFEGRHYTIGNGPPMYEVRPSKSQEKLLVSYTDYRQCGDSLGPVILPTNY